MKPFFKNASSYSIFHAISRFTKRRYLIIPAVAALSLLGYDVYRYKMDRRSSILFRRYIDARVLANAGLTTHDFFRYIQELSSINQNDAKIPTVKLSINYKNLINLECQRRKKINNYSCPRYTYKQSKGTLISDSDKFRVKLRPKGDRKLHYENPNDFSTKVDIRGNPRLWGMEEFSIQDPIIRNYTYEAFSSKALRDEGIVTPRHYYAKLYLNGVNKGIKHFEETIARELIESNARRYGPTFSLDETSQEPQTFELQDAKYWSESNPEMASHGLYLLNKIYTNPQLLRENILVDKWARYFAFIDVFNLYHGSVRKSVKFYYNPVYGKIEPVFVDGHTGAGRFKDFLLVDFLTKENPSCEWICGDKAFYKVFMGTKEQPNVEFVHRYLYHLNHYSSKAYVDKYLSYINMYANVRGELYRNIAPSDSIFHRSIIPHILSVDKIKTRAHNIRAKMPSINKEVGAYLSLRDTTKDDDREVQYFSDKIFITADTIYKDKTIVFNSNTKFIISPGTTLSFKNSTIKTLGDAQIYFNGEKSSMVVFENISGKVNNLTANKLGANPSKVRILDGGLNFINSNLTVDELTVRNSFSEDGVNLIDSDMNLSTIKLENIQSDALDSDFSKLKVDNITCSNVENDCLDISFSEVNIGKLTAINIKDKAVSAGERSSLKLKKIKVTNSEIGIVAKDQSSVNIDIISLSNVKVPIALFVKKPEFGSPELIIAKEFSKTLLSRSLVSKDSKFIVNGQVTTGIYSSKEVLGKLYGNEFGAKTIR